MTTLTTPLDRQQSTAEALMHKSRLRDASGIVLQMLLLFALLFSVLVLIVLIADILVGGLGVLIDRPVDFLTLGNSATASKAGVWQAIVGSLWLTLIVAVVAFPLGIGAAIYLEEYARDNAFTRFVIVNVRNLAGVPSVVYGLLGLAIFVEALRGFSGGRSLIAAGFTLAILVLPIVVIVTSEALRAVPIALREGGFGIGATRWEVTRRLVLPQAAPMILTGAVLSISRAIGETAPLILVGAITSFFATQASSIGDVMQGKFTALPVIIFGWARQPGDEFRALTAAAIIVLLVVLLTVNALAIFVRNRYDKRRHEL